MNSSPRLNSLTPTEAKPTWIAALSSTYKMCLLLVLVSGRRSVCSRWTWCFIRIQFKETNQQQSCRPVWFRFASDLQNPNVCVRGPQPVCLHSLSCGSTGHVNWDQRRESSGVTFQCFPQTYPVFELSMTRPSYDLVRSFDTHSDEETPTDKGHEMVERKEAHDHFV